MAKSDKINATYGNQSPGDNKFTAKARLLQSMYRVSKCESRMGRGPSRNSTDKDGNPTFYGNMLVNGKYTGKNFFFNETFEYAIKRVDDPRVRKPEETIDEYRLFNNMLSSMPMAFNLFHPLMMIRKQYPDQLNRIVAALFPEFPVVQVDEIKIEFIPTPIGNYTRDYSAMDAAIFFSDEDNNKYLIAIETKYTDVLGSNLGSNNDVELAVAMESGLFTTEGLEKIRTESCNQIYRNFLLTEKYRMVHKLKDSCSIVLAPKDHPTTEGEINSLLDYLKPENRYKLSKYTLEDFLKVIQENCPEEFKGWTEDFMERYLRFENVEMIM